MPSETTPPDTTKEIRIDLRQPGVAAVWAWLWPGAGHIYQRRYAKGILFMVCILGTYFFGLGMARGQVVYAQLERPPNLRWHYILQLGVGLPAAPAIVQNLRVSSGKPPLFGEFMSPPGPTYNDHRDKLAKWHDQNHMFFEIGTLYTVIAGLLNVLAIYDAYAGPVIASPEDEKDKDKGKKDGEGSS